MSAPSDPLSSSPKVTGSPSAKRSKRARAPVSRTISWRVRLALAAFMIAAGAIVWFTNKTLTHSFTETTRNRAELRLALYSGNLVSELRRHAIVPQLLARDQALISALQSQDFSLSTQRLDLFCG